MSKNRKKTEEEADERVTVGAIVEKNEIRMRIRGLLTIYKELSFTELCDKIGKSKSTVHPHLQVLLKHNVVQEVREQKVRGNIPAKYYSLGSDVYEILEFATVDMSKGIDERIADVIIKTGKHFNKYHKSLLEMWIKFFNKMGRSENAVKIFNEMPYYTEGYGGTTMYLTADQLKRWRKLYFDLEIDFNKQIIKENKDNPSIEKPYYFYAQVLPLKKLFEEIE